MLALGEKDKFTGILGTQFYLNWRQFRNLIDHFAVVDKMTDNAALVNVSRKVSVSERIHKILDTVMTTIVVAVRGEITLNYCRFVNFILMERLVTH